MKKNKHINKIFKLFFIFFFLLVGTFLISKGYSYLKTKLDITGDTNIVDPQYNCSEMIDYELTTWNHENLYYYKFLFTITNNSDKSYNNWTVVFDIPDDGDLYSYSGTEASISGNQIKADSVHYNSVILPKDKVQFEVQVKTANSSYEPTYIYMMNCNNNFNSGTENPPSGGDNPGTENPPSGGDTPGTENPPSGNEPDILDINFKITTSYGSYTYIYDVEVINNSDFEIKNWDFEIELPENTKLTNAWNVNYIVKEDRIELSNMTYNGTIPIGGSTTFGIVLDTDIYMYEPKVIK